MTSKVLHAWHAWRYLGPRWLAYRLSYAARSHIGMLRRHAPATGWPEQPLRDFLEDATLAEPQAYLEYRRNQKFFFSPSARHDFQSRFAQWDGEGTTPVEAADEIAGGTLRYFAHLPLRTGFPPDWHVNPLTGQRTPAHRHWSQIGDYSYGDIKVLWEPSRFGFVYDLVRAYWRGADERCADLFWRLVEDWRSHNPPMQGVNWKCGQEVSLRVMAWCFGLFGFLESEATTARRVSDLARMIAVSGQRIETNLSYALSQNNNHSISEGTGLWTIGILFPEFKQASRWRSIGRQILDEEGRKLIYDDGSFAQHSVNYHRLMLHDYIWALRLGDVFDSRLSAELRERVSRAAAFLYQLQDEKSGRVPCYGQNDGALVLPLNNCDYQDFRPVIQSAYYLGSSSRCYHDGPWDEDLLWLFGPETLTASVVAPRRSDLDAKTGGYYTLRSRTGFAFVRCATFRHRPGQADMLHLDLWWRGENIALDAGTFSYNAPPPWNDPFAHTAYHNTVTVDGLDQMDRAGRFLWLPWVQAHARCHKRSAAGQLAYWEGEQDGYRRLSPPVSYRRGVLRLGDDAWLVLDGLTSEGDHRYRLHWLFRDAPHAWNERDGRLVLQTPGGPYYAQLASCPDNGLRSLVRADQHSPRGWRAPYYNYREPALSVDLTTRSKTAALWTLFSPESCQVDTCGETLRIEADSWSASLDRRTDSQSPMLSSVFLSGRGIEDRLEIA